MTDQEILDNAPEGATEIDDIGNYLIYEEGGDDLLWDNGSWFKCFAPSHTRSLADIKRIAELELEKITKATKYMCLETVCFKQQELIAELERENAVFKRDAETVHEKLKEVLCQSG